MRSHSIFLFRFRTATVSDVIVTNLLEKFIWKMDSIQRRDLNLTIETHDATKAKLLPGVELEISHGFKDAPEHGSAKSGGYCST